MSEIVEMIRNKIDSLPELWQQVLDNLGFVLVCIGIVLGGREKKS